MNTKFTIKNFRVFDENGTTIDLKPLTIFTGCNSSGKSSIVKALLLLSDYFSSLKTAKDNGRKVVLSSHELDFTKKPHNLLGRFSMVINNSDKSKNVTFELRVHSYMLAKDLDVELVFSSERGYSNGQLNSVRIKDLDGRTIYSSKKDMAEIEGDFSCLLPAFINHVSMEDMISSHELRQAKIDVFDGTVISVEKKVQKNEEFESYRNKFETDFGSEVLKDIYKWSIIRRRNAIKENRPIVSFLGQHSEGKPEIIDKVKKTGILYYLPILEKLHGKKDECISFLMTSRDKFVDSSGCWSSIGCWINKVLTDFQNSSSQSFLEYYKLWEIQYLSKFKKQSAPLADVPLDSPKLFSPKFIRLGNGFGQYKQSKLEFDPHVLELLGLPDSDPLDFEHLYIVLAHLSSIFVPDNKIHYNKSHGEEYLDYESRTEYLFFKFIEEAIEEIVVDETPNALAYVSSSVANVKRIYPLETEDEFTSLLKRYANVNNFYSKRLVYSKLMGYIPRTFLNYWINQFAIGDHISFNDVNGEGLGVILRVHKTPNDQKGSLLADLGYGITQLLSTILSIEMTIMERKVTEVFLDKKTLGKIGSSPTIAIEEPEIHLHPAYQSLLADMFIEAYQKYDIHFIIETHSEYLIRKLQVMVVDKENPLSANDISLNYVEKNSDGLSTNRKINIQDNGKLSEPFGTGFFDESKKLVMNLLRF